MILCCGEALIDMLPVTMSGRDRAEAYQPHCGGAAFNSAIALGRLGQASALISGVSTDLFGEKLRNELRASDVSTDLAIATGRPTTLAFVRLEQGQARYEFWDQGSAMREITPLDLPAIPAAADLLLFGGISLCNLPMADSFVHLAKQAQGNQILMLDLNIRPGFAEDELAYLRRLKQMIMLCDIVKLSQEDLEHYCPDQTSEEARLRAFCEQAPGLVLFTRAEAGAIAILPSGLRVEVETEKVEIVDTVGAGDSFNAGFLTALSRANALSRSRLQSLEQTELRDALIFATRVATVSVTRSGANPPRLHEL